MGPSEAKFATLLILIFSAPFMLMNWLLALKPVSNDGDYCTKGALKIRSKSMSVASVRYTALLCALASLVINSLVALSGYQWWFGIVAHAGLWMPIMLHPKFSATPEQFRPAMRVFSLGFIPCVIAYALAWFTYVQWMVFPLSLFLLANAVSLATFIYVVVKPSTSKV